MSYSPEDYANYIVWLAGEVDNEPDFDENGQPIVNRSENEIIAAIFGNS